MILALAVAVAGGLDVGVVLRLAEGTHPAHLFAHLFAVAAVAVAQRGALDDMI